MLNSLLVSIVLMQVPTIPLTGKVVGPGGEPAAGAVLADLPRASLSPTGVRIRSKFRPETPPRSRACSSSVVPASPCPGSLSR